MVEKILLSLALVTSVAHSVRAEDCRPAIAQVIAKAFPKSTLKSCKPEGDRVEVIVVKADGARIEVDVSADAKILMVEEVVPLDQVPAAVMKAFATRYPKAKATAAERQTPTTGTRSYELAFSADGKKKEATFAEDGKFVEEE